MVALDVGSNLGVFTTVFASGVGESGRVFAFEPDPLSRGLLRQRCRRLSNVEVVGCAAGDRSGAAVLHCHRANRADNRLHDSLGAAEAERVAVEVVSLDDFCGARGLRVDAVKIDVQGWEVAVLRGLRETMRRAPPRWMLIELEPRLLAAAGADAGELWNLVDAYGYDAYSLGGDGPVLPGDRQRLLGEGKRPAIDLWLRRRVHV
jgi:FkbM family methyltransferase